MAFNLGTEGIVIIVVVVILFGAAAIPKLARALGRAQGEFKKAKKEFDREVQSAEGSTIPSGEETEEARIRRTARESGIEEEGRPLDEVKKELNEKLS